MILWRFQLMGLLRWVAELLINLNHSDGQGIIACWSYKPPEGAEDPGSRSWWRPSHATGYWWSESRTGRGWFVQCPMFNQGIYMLRLQAWNLVWFKTSTRCSPSDDNEGRDCDFGGQDDERSCDEQLQRRARWW